MTKNNYTPPITEVVRLQIEQTVAISYDSNDRTEKMYRMDEEDL